MVSKLAKMKRTVSPAARALVRVVDESGTPIERADFYVELPSRGPRIIEAYQQLVAEGYLASRSGGYTQVAVSMPSTTTPEPKPM